MNRLVAALLLALGLCASPPAMAQSFRIEGVAVEPSAYLHPDVIADVTGKYVKRPITFADLQQMIAEINGLYAAAGVPTAQAVLPPQVVSDGILKVSLVEAEIEEVEFVGLRNTSERFLRRNISLPAGAKPDYDRIERDLQVFDIAHDISPRLSFGPGRAVGTTRAIVTAEEPKRFSITASVDNFGRPETGEARATLFGRWSSVTGVRDTLSFQLQASQGAKSASLGYSRPVGTGGGRVVATLSFAQSAIIGGEFTPVSIVSDSLGGSLSYRRPAWVRPDRYWLLEGGVTFDSTESTIDGLTFADVRLWDAFLTARYNRRYDRAILGFSAGLRIGQAEALGTSETEGSYWLIYGEGTYARPINDRFMFNGALRYQYAHGQNLPVARLFTVGGVGTLRGYPNDIRAGDSGVLVNLQVSTRKPITPRTMPRWKISPFAFVDAALVVPYRVDGGIDGEQDLLASFGAGASVAVGKANVLAVVGVPIKDTLGFDEAGKPRFYLGLDYSF
ncbi:ShlB/FhaC/HecB family hemolysin secretion/activation protein [Vannielia litorea]|uniref:Hemolysin activation/secretion protein n=1 Tax=Vannielia litorea TaxID=1217970 RepID=A0A1N6F424_9RHOB|nr:ShlB/FhaC/HecB family hemolysin secretion/activation protein [Vannielia litorea]SIN90015.1 Hemolysin activation/secretion protein [Vannielia litorea]